MRWRPERGLASFHSGVGFLRLSHPGLVSVLFSAPSLLEMKFFQKLFPLVIGETQPIYNVIFNLCIIYLNLIMRMREQCVPGLPPEGLGTRLYLL